MHRAAIQLGKDIHRDFLKEKGYQFVANTFRLEFPGGRVISRLRGCSKYNRDDARRWRFQVDSRIVFDDLDYDPQHWPVGAQPSGRYAGGLYSIEDSAKGKPRRIANDICSLTDRLIVEAEGIRAAYAARLKAKREGPAEAPEYVARKLNTSEIAEVGRWLAKKSRRYRTS